MFLTYLNLLFNIVFQSLNNLETHYPFSKESSFFSLTTIITRDNLFRGYHEKVSYYILRAKLWVDDLCL